MMLTHSISTRRHSVRVGSRQFQLNSTGNLLVLSLISIYMCKLIYTYKYLLNVDLNHVIDLK